MTHIIAVAHGQLATALLDTARMIIGPTGEASAVEFNAGSSVEDLTARLNAEIERVQTQVPHKEILILTDVAGGSPSRVGLSLAITGKASVVTGINLPMLLDVLVASASSSASELAERAVSSGQSGIKDLGEFARNQGVIQ